MKKRTPKLILLVCVICSFTHTYGVEYSVGRLIKKNRTGYTPYISASSTSSGKRLWIHTSQNVENGRAIQLKVDPSTGDAIVVGYFEGTLTLMGLELQSSESTGFILRCNAKGEGLWAKKISSTKESLIHSLTLDNSGNIYFSGYSESASSIESKTLTSQLGSFLTKLTPQGNIDWVHVDEEAVFGASVVYDKIGNTIFWQKVRENESVNNAYYSQIEKISTTNQSLWTKSIEGHMLHRVTIHHPHSELYITVDNNGNPIHGQVEAYALSDGSWKKQLVVRKYDAFSQELLFEKVIATTDGINNLSVKNNLLNIRDIASYADGSIMVLSLFSKDVILHDSTGDKTISSKGQRDILITKLDENSSLIFANWYGDSKNDYANFIGHNQTHQIIGGCFYGNLTIENDQFTGSSSSPKVYHTYYAQLPRLASNEEIADTEGGSITTSNTFNLYPNPATKDQPISLLYDFKENHTYQVVAYNTEGMAIKSLGFYHFGSSGSVTSASVPLNGLNSGIYILNLFEGDQLVSQNKLLIK